MIVSRLLPIGVLEQVTDVVDQHGADVAVYTHDTIFIRTMNPKTQLIVDYNEPTPVEVGRWEALNGALAQTCKLLVLNRHTTDASAGLAAALSHRLGATTTVIRSNTTMIEVIDPVASKGMALAALAQHLNITLSETLAIGDSYNDISMLEIAGMSAAMGNAPAEVQRAAKIVIGTNDEDGVARYLQTIDEIA
jgi:Cof subfamily protein (haloacid dehalogenase superfamily)